LPLSPSARKPRLIPRCLLRLRCQSQVSSAHSGPKATPPLPPRCPYLSALPTANCILCADLCVSALKSLPPRLLYSSVHILLAALFFFAILTLWIPALWPVTLFEIGIFALAAVAVLRARRNPPPFAFPLLPLAFAPLWGIFQLLTARTVYPFDTLNSIVQWTLFLAVFFLGLSLFRSPPIALWFRSAMLWFAFLVSVLATLQAFTAGGRVFWLWDSPVAGLLMGPFPSRNHYAAFIEAVLPLALYQAMHPHRPAPRPSTMSSAITSTTSSAIASAIPAAMYASVIASASRAGSLLATAEIVAVPLLLWARGFTPAPAIRSAFLRIALLLALFTAIVGPQTVWSRFWTPDPYAARREFAVSSLHMLAAHPWFGTGLGTWPTAYPRYALADFGAVANQAHSDWLQWAAEGGFPFALMLAALFVWSLRPARDTVWGLGVLAVFLHAAVDYPFSRPALGAWPILLLALLAVWEHTDSGEAGPDRRTYPQEF
jgi:O-antigen ligase